MPTFTLPLPQPEGQHWRSMLPVRFRHRTEGYALLHGQEYEFPVVEELERELLEGRVTADFEIKDGEPSAIVIRPEN